MTDLEKRLQALLTPNSDGLLPCECGGNVTMSRIGNESTRKRAITATCDSCRRSVTHASLLKSMEWLEKLTRESLNHRPLVRALVEAVNSRYDGRTRSEFEAKIITILDGEGAP